MLSGTTPEKIIDYVRLSVYLSCCWPLPATASKIQVIRFKAQYIGCILNATILFCGLLYALYLHLDDIGIVVRSSCLLIAVAQLITQTPFATSQYERLRRLIAEMEDYCKRAEKYERDILQQYVDNCSTFYGGCILWFYSSAAAFIAGTLLTSQQFPTEAEYPFAVTYQPMKTIIYLHQSVVGVQCAAQICVNAFIALLLWFAAARFDILSMELESITDIHKLITCVQRYHQAKRYATETTVAVRYLILITIGLSAAALICASITFLGKQQLPIKVQFLLLSATALLEVFMCAWPADHLKNMSMDVIQGAYKSIWYERTSEIKKDILFVLLPKKPVTVSVIFLMPTLSLNYYCTITGKFLAIWPLDSSAGKLQLLSHQILWWIYFLNAILMLSAIVIGIRCCYTSLKELMGSLVEGTYMLEALFDLIYWRLKKLEFQSVISEIEKFDRVSTRQEKMLKQMYLNRARIIITVLSSAFIIGAALFILSPLIRFQRVTPLNTVYFAIPTEKYWGWCIVYALNLFAIAQISVTVIVDLIVLSILLHASYKFELVGVTINRITQKQLREFVRMHQDSISYAKEIERIITPIVVKTTACAVAYTIFCSLLIAYNVPFLELTQFFVVTLFSILRIFVSSWSAGIMTETAYNVSWRIYDLPWNDATSKVCKTMLIIFQRCHKATIIRASDIGPALSVEFFGSTMYKTVSFFATMRAILHL